MLCIGLSGGMWQPSWTQCSTLVYCDVPIVTSYKKKSVNMQLYISRNRRDTYTEYLWRWKCCHPWPFPMEASILYKGHVVLIFPEHVFLLFFLELGSWSSSFMFTVLIYPWTLNVFTRQETSPSSYKFFWHFTSTMCLPMCIVQCCPFSNLDACIIQIKETAHF